MAELNMVKSGTIISLLNKRTKSGKDLLQSFKDLLVIGFPNIKKEEINKTIRSQNKQIYVGLYNGILVGGICFKQHIDGHIEIIYIVINPEYRSNSLGTLLLSELKKNYTDNLIYAFADQYAIYFFYINGFQPIKPDQVEIICKEKGLDFFKNAVLSKCIPSLCDLNENQVLVNKVSSIIHLLIEIRKVMLKTPVSKIIKLQIHYFKRELGEIQNKEMVIPPFFDSRSSFKVDQSVLQSRLTQGLCGNCGLANIGDHSSGGYERPCYSPAIIFKLEGIIESPTLTNKLKKRLMNYYY